MTTPHRTANSRTVPEVEAFDNRFADNLRTFRRALKISRNDLAEMTGIPWHSIEKIERATRADGLRRRVTIGEAVVLAEALGMTPGELLKGAAS